MEHLTGLLSEGLRKEIYDLWNVSVCSTELFLTSRLANS